MLILEIAAGVFLGLYAFSTWQQFWGEFPKLLDDLSEAPGRLREWRARRKEWRESEKQRREHEKMHPDDEAQLRNAAREWRRQHRRRL